MGSGMCIVFAPHTFAHDEEAKATIVDPGGDPIDAVRNAVEGCPTRALHVLTDQATEPAD